MSTAPQQSEPNSEPTEQVQSTESESSELVAQVETLEAENRRLRAAYNRVTRVRYRRTAYGLAGIGVAALAAGLVVTTAQDVLIVVGFIGLFGALLTWYLTPTRVVAAAISNEVFETAARNYERIITQLGLTDTRIYLPAATGPATLFVPGTQEYELPEPDDGPFVVETDQHGLLVDALGSSLFDEFERALTGPVATTPEPLAAQLTDGLTEQFELVDAMETDIDQESQQAVIRLSGCTFTPVDAVDNPIVSFLAVGFATGLSQPVSVTVTETDTDSDWLVTIKWGKQ